MGWFFYFMLTNGKSLQKRIIHINEFIAENSEQRKNLENLIDGMIKLDPKKRTVVEDVLDHSYFTKKKRKLLSSISASGYDE